MNPPGGTKVPSSKVPLETDSNARSLPGFPMASNLPGLLRSEPLMSRTIFILGTDPEHCAELRTVLQAAVSDTVVATSPIESLPRLQDSDTVVISSEERHAGVIYRQLI